MDRKRYAKYVKQISAWLTDERASSHERPPCDFTRLRHEIRPADVLLVEGKSRVSRVIQRFTQSPWTHAALYIGKLSDIEDSALRSRIEKKGEKPPHTRYIIESILGKGTVISPLNIYRFNHIRICRPIGLTPIDASQVIAYAIHALGKPYNIRQIIDLARLMLPWSILPQKWGSSLFRSSTGEPKYEICSTLIAEAFYSVHFPILPIVNSNQDALQMIQQNPYLFTPKDFDYSPYFDIIKYPMMDLDTSVPYYRRFPWHTHEASVKIDQQKA